ncbi:TPA: hypothetical protein HA265_08685 [Candidatus Woesearchaeota archaeon]|nr:hypothetical protein [Candidatus Woesearchaeota archaeon]
MSGAIEDILRKDPRVVHLEPAEKWEMPELDATQFSSRRLGYVAYAYSMMCNILGYHYLVDNITGQRDSEREAWKEELTRTYGSEVNDYFEKNSIKVNSLAQLIKFSEMLTDQYIGQNREVLVDMISSLKCFEDALRAYRSKTPDERLSIAKEVKKKSYEILKTVTRS